MSGGLLTTGYYLLLCVFLLLLVHRLLCRLSIFIASALVLIPLLPTGRSLVTGGFHGALNATYSTPPLLAQSWRLEETGYQNGNLHDVTTLMFPSWQVSREALRAGRVPFLNHANGMGELLLAAQEAVPFHLFTLLALPLSAAQSWTLALTLKFFFAILFTFLLLRELGVREEIALFGGSVYGLSTFLLFWNGWTMATVFSTASSGSFGVVPMALR